MLAGESDTTKAILPLRSSIPISRIAAFSLLASSPCPQDPSCDLNGKINDKNQRPKGYVLTRRLIFDSSFVLLPYAPSATDRAAAARLGTFRSKRRRRIFSCSEHPPRGSRSPVGGPVAWLLPQVPPSCHAQCQALRPLLDRHCRSWLALPSSRIQPIAQPADETCDAGQPSGLCFFVFRLRGADRSSSACVSVAAENPRHPRNVGPGARQCAP